MDNKVVLNAAYVGDTCYLDRDQLVLMILDLAEQEELLHLSVEANTLRRLARILISGNRKRDLAE